MTKLPDVPFGAYIRRAPTPRPANDNYTTRLACLMALVRLRARKGMEDCKRFLANVPSTAGAYREQVKVDQVRLERARMDIMAYIQMLPILEAKERLSSDLEPCRRKLRTSSENSIYPRCQSKPKIDVDVDYLALDIILADTQPA